MKIWTAIVLGMLATTAASAQTPSLKPDLQGLGFLVGHWSTPVQGKVVETGGRTSGEMRFTPKVSGAVLLREDHVHLYAPSGQPTGDFDILMMIYPEAGGVHADYSDGEHIIHYTSAHIDPGHAVVFTTMSSPSAMSFKLSYTLNRPGVLDIAFSMAAPGSADFHPIAVGSATKDPDPAH